MKLYYRFGLNTTDMVSISMEDKKLIDLDVKGSYCILFRNKQALELPEIEQIFAQFGKVFNIRKSGDKTGYCFIRYKTLDEAENAVKGLQNHPAIKLGYHTPKNKNEITSTNKFNKNNKMNFKAKNKNSKNKESSVINSQTNSIAGSIKLDRNEPHYSSSICSFDHELDTLSIHSHENYQNNGDVNDIPDLINSSGKIINHMPRKIIKPAEEVIVGNIHSDLTAAYILHLFDQYEPLAISKIENIPKSDLNFCRVYFKTRNDAMKVEDKYDLFSLKGKKLLVLRPSRLQEEAENCHGL